jgi:hemerythrin
MISLDSRVERCSMRIEWTEDLALGVEELDAQHRALYAHVDQLLEAMAAGQSAGAASLLGFLHAYSRQHFRAEERLMREGGYADAEKHAALHRAFASALRERAEAFRARGATTSLSVDLCAWLTDWLREHLRGADAQLGRWLRARRR